MNDMFGAEIPPEVLISGLLDDVDRYKRERDQAVRWLKIAHLEAISKGHLTLEQDYWSRHRKLEQDCPECAFIARIDQADKAEVVR